MLIKTYSVTVQRSVFEIASITVEASSSKKALYTAKTLLTNGKRAIKETDWQKSSEKIIVIYADRVRI